MSLATATAPILFEFRKDNEKTSTQILKIMKTVLLSGFSDRKELQNITC
jgi:hypothetical protein